MNIMINISAAMPSSEERKTWYVMMKHNFLHKKYCECEFSESFWLLKRARVGANRPPHTLLITQ
jgi:hypothetical protein